MRTWQGGAVSLVLFVAVSALAVGQAQLASRRLFLGAAFLLTILVLVFVLAAVHRGPEAFFDARLFGLAGIFVFLVAGMLKSVLIYDVPVTTDLATAAKAVLVVILSLAGFSLGGAVKIPPATQGRMSVSALSANRLLAATLFLGGIGLAGAIWFNNPLAPFDPVASNYGRLWAGCLPAAGALALWQLIVLRPASLPHRLALFTVLVPWPVLALVSDSRVPLAFLVSFAFLAYVYRLWLDRPGSFPLARVAVLAVCVVFFLLVSAAVVDVLAAAQWRVDVSAAPYHLDSVLQPARVALEQFTAIDAFDNLVRSIELYPDRGRYLYGWSLVAVVVNPVPRSLWPGKPYGYGRLLVEELGLGRYRQLSFSTSLAGEWLANFGYLGPFVGYLLLGLLAGTLYDRFLRARSGSPFHVLYLAALMLFLLESRGDLLSITVRLGWYLVCLYAALRFASVEAPLAAEHGDG